MKEIQSKLAEPFGNDDIEWRIQQSGKTSKGFWAIAVPYVTNRAIMNRLDDVVGIFNWQDEYKQAPLGGVLCGISIRYNDEWITKWDGADNTKYEPTKGGLSDAEKRAAVKWGIGRDLYKLDIQFVETSETKKEGYHKAFTEQKEPFYWKKPDIDAVRKGKTTSEPATEKQLNYLKKLGYDKEVTFDEATQLIPALTKFKELTSGLSAEERKAFAKKNNFEKLSDLKLMDLEVLILGLENG